jgi:hypothetical protein
MTVTRRPHRALSMLSTMFVASISLVACGSVTSPATTASHHLPRTVVCAARNVPSNRSFRITISADGMNLRYEQDPGNAGVPSSVVSLRYRGTPIYSRSLASIAQNPGALLVPLRAPGTSGALCLARLGYSESVMAIVDYGWPCANECQTMAVLEPARGGRSVVVKRLVGLAPLRLALVESQLLIVGEDERFLCVFTYCEASGQPVVIELARGTNIVDDSRAFPSLLSTDARVWRREFAGLRKTPGVGYELKAVGKLAPWLADECRLGRARSAWTFFRRQVSPSFRRGVVRDLVGWGYCPIRDLSGS